jgi:hypothetical protein
MLEHILHPPGRPGRRSACTCRWHPGPARPGCARSGQSCPTPGVASTRCRVAASNPASTSTVYAMTRHQRHAPLPPSNRSFPQTRTGTSRGPVAQAAVDESPSRRPTPVAQGTLFDPSLLTECLLALAAVLVLFHQCRPLLRCLSLPTLHSFHYGRLSLWLVVRLSSRFLSGHDRCSSQDAYRATACDEL